MHQSLTISMLSSLRRNISWMSWKWNMISLTLTIFYPKILGGYRAQILLRSSLHALVNQLCILFIKPGSPSIKEWVRKSLPYSNFIRQSGKSAMSSTPIFRRNSWSVRGTEMPGHLVALESETSFDLSFALSFDLSLVFAVCHLFTISESSFWYDRITCGTYNCPSCCCGGG